MAPRKAASTPTDWPRLDLPKHQIQSLSMAWYTESDDFANAVDDEDITDFADFDAGGALADPVFGLDLLEELVPAGTLSALVRYTRNHVRLRYVQVAIPRLEGGCDIHVQYEHDPDWLPLTMTNDKPAERAFTALAQGVTDAPSADCRVDFVFPAEIAYETVVQLPFMLEPRQEGPWPIGGVTGLRGIGVNPANPDQPTCRFTLEREHEGNVLLLLEFSAPTPPTPAAPTQVLKQAVMLADQFVRPAPR